MEKFVYLKLHHQGQFQCTRYAGGEQTIVMDIGPDLFSYTVLMEHVKDELLYAEIGSFYITMGKIYN